ncbi:MAG: hypothetical protein H7Y38_00060 [Armatimonadetes bacterium]|nr:hypothetical protein [Armatimonadota bacterium]
MPPSTAMTDTTDTEETLRYWLAQEDVYPSRYTQNFLKETAEDDAGDILDSIARDAEPQMHSYLELLWTAFATIGFLPSGGGKIPRRKAGVRAALMLSDRDDARCVAPLVRVFETDPMWQNRYQTQIVSALTHYFSRNAGKVTASEVVADAERIAGRVWRYTPRRDLPEAWARLVVAALSFVHAAGAGADLLDAVAGAKVDTLPNRAGVREAVGRLLEGQT